jgi:glycosyltransferase involved in cell wall biosynthesis
MEMFYKMKIWFAAAITRDSAGGVAASMRGLSEVLKNRGHDCRMLTAGSSSLSRNYLWFCLTLAARLVVSRRDRPDWIVARSTDGLACSLCSRLFGLKTKTALHNHGWEEKVYEAEKEITGIPVVPKTTWKARLLRFPLLRAMLFICDACICGTIEEARWLGKRYPDAKGKLFCVPNGVAVRPGRHWDFHASPPLHFLFVGSVTWKKNVGYAVSVFNDLKKRRSDARLSIIGASAEEIVALAGNSSGIDMVKSVPPYEMARWYARCPFFISCSRYEGGRSLALLEAMSFGCVAFVSAIHSSREVIHDRVNGIVLSSTNPGKDAGVIADTIASVGLCDSLSSKAYVFSKRQSWERQARRCERILCNRR